MASRATTPERRLKFALYRAVRGGGLSVGLALLFGAGCPPRDSGITISQQGADYLVDSCTGNIGYCMEAFDRYFPGMNCCNVYTTDDTTSPANGGGRYSSPQLVTTNLQGPLQARMYLLTTSDFKVKSASKCMNLKCGDAGSFANMKKTGYLSSCLAEGLNQGLDGAMPTGLSADGLKNSGDAILFMSIHEASDPDCSLATIRACAGLAPLGGSNYDIVCASCNGGPLESVGSYTGPCPRSSDESPSCFLKKCKNWIEAAGY